MSHREVVAVILGGGVGSRLYPLTRDRAKPAVPLAGKYRLVDVPISNCLNSGIRQIYLLTQFNSVSLHHHVQSTYTFGPHESDFVQLLAAQQTLSNRAWYQGTADAVRQSLQYLCDSSPKLVVVLSGDQLCRIDIEECIAFHRESQADITVAAKPVSRAEAGDLGIMRVDPKGRIVHFAEKPGDALDGLSAPLFPRECYLASMGIYVFNTEVLVRALDNEMGDFGGDIIPSCIENHRVNAFTFDGYWRDIGTIESFWETSLALTDPNPEFTFYDPEAPVFTRMRYLPPSRFEDVHMSRAMVSDGCRLSGAEVRRSVIGIRSVIRKGARIEDSILMGADSYESHSPEGTPALGIGRDCKIRRAIIDKDARIGDGCVIAPDGHTDGEETPQYVVRGGIIVIPKKAVIPAGTTL